MRTSSSSYLYTMQGIRAVSCVGFLLAMLLFPFGSQAGEGFFIGGGLVEKRVDGTGHFRSKGPFDITSPFVDTIKVKQENQTIISYAIPGDPSGFNLSNRYFTGFTGYVGYKRSNWSLTLEYGIFLRRTGRGEVFWDSVSIFSNANYRSEYKYEIRVMHHDALFFLERQIGKTGFVAALGAAYSFERSTQLRQWHIYRQGILIDDTKYRNVYWAAGIGCLLGFGYQKEFSNHTFIRITANYSFAWSTHGASLVASIGTFLKRH